jgi:hypothetical protein
MHPLRPWCAAGVLAAAASVVVAATVTSRDARASDDNATASALVLELGQNPAHASIAATAIANAKDALERALRLRAVGDEVHAKAADGLAREWADTARDLARAADAERAAWDARRKAEDAKVRLERARAHVEEGIARVGRMRSELDEAGRAPSDRTAVEPHGPDRTARKKAEGKEPPVKRAAAGETP